MVQIQADSDPKRESNAAGIELEMNMKELERIETEQSHHVRTIGSRRQTDSDLENHILPAFGADKPYPPMLDSVQGAYLVEFDGPDVRSTL